MKTIDLNADVGEIPELAQVEEALLDVVTSVNVACGGHAGDATSMERVVRAAMARGVAVGAHPSYPDREGFGRRKMRISLEDVSAAVAGQVAAFLAVARLCGARLEHVKPHGALYNAAAKDEALARAIAEGVARVAPGVVLVGLAGSVMLQAFSEEGFPFAGEAFADRGYEPDGTLTPRGQPGALKETAEEAAKQAVSIATRGEVVASSAEIVAVDARTLCLHSDTPGAVDFARAIAARLREAGVEIRAL
ncbi:MAG TPA: 5-oxoprolinase subunit PxpA [Thermoanaerobaculia bacterium]|nr:5-oxoprolinase subunit PxpA [Thermoanaerobaculia bacterium]